MKRGGVIAVAGKGGTGKTAISALLIRELKESADGDGDDICILAVDADADSNLPDALGISYNKSVGDIRRSYWRRSSRMLRWTSGRSLRVK